MLAEPTPNPSLEGNCGIFVFYKSFLEYCSMLAEPTPNPSQEGKPTPNPSQEGKPTPNPSQEGKPTPNPSQEGNCSIFVFYNVLVNFLRSVKGLGVGFPSREGLGVGNFIPNYL